MGQSSIPSLNRTGFSMFWISSWDDLHDFSSNIKEDLFIRKFIKYVFNDKVSVNPFFLNKIKLKKDLFKKYNLNYDVSLSSKQLSRYLFRNFKIPFYISKIRVLKYSGWVIIYFYLLNSSKVKNKNISLGFNALLQFSKKDALFNLKKKINFDF